MRLLSFFLTSALCIALTAMTLPAANAHFPWLVPPSENETQFEVMFSEDFEPYDDSILEKIAHEKVYAYSSDGLPTEISLELIDSKLIGKLPDGKQTVLLEMPFTWGMFKPGGQAFLLRYRAIAVLNQSAASKLDLSEHDGFGPRLRVASEGMSLQVDATSQTTALADAAVKVIGSEPGDIKTDANGKASMLLKGKGGLYGLMANSSVKEKGDWKGDAYETIKCYSTVSLRLPTNVAYSPAVAAISTSVPKVSSYAPLPVTVTSFGAAKCNDSLYVYGGHLGDAHSYSTSLQSNQLLRLDLANPKSEWKVVSETDRLQGHVMIAHAGKLIRIGGFSARNNDGQPHDLHSTDAVMAFDTHTQQWSPLPNLPEPRSSHDAVLVGDTVYVVGGWKLDDPNEQQWHSTAYSMDLSIETPQWRAIATPPFQRRALSLAVLDGQIIAIGGMEGEGAVSKATVYYNPVNDSWSDGPELVGEGKLTGFGTAAVSDRDRVIVNCIDGSLQQLTAGSDKWELCGKTSDSRFFQELLQIGPNQLVSIGGANMESGKFHDLEVINLPQNDQ